MIDVDYNIYKMVLEENMKLIVENHNQKETYKHLKELYEVALKDYDEATKRIDKAINRISLIRMDGDTSIETHKALDEILNILLGSEKE